MTWDRKLWGVVLLYRRGGLWVDVYGLLPAPKQVPPRTTLFMTRQQAREWCKGANRSLREDAWYASVRRYRVVRVRERVTIVEG